ncbi:hypothetical protein JKI95_11205 [Corynebacterium aquatimens]|uniref:hypothetical protein n=1 Tax=Corynebacterium TaxID=1716 RepID=UPI001F43ECD9|nr:MULTISPECIES: hypothetical protein [Corynebacterium]QYH19570.1 hypothetical protein JKI95_11205 [Corynebacterium aquatimens]UIZ91465.1 hypothetical protein JZY91_06765 [Corynebacterium sp. CNCTC7651]
MKKLLAVPVAALLAVGMAGCTVMDVVGPRPNKEIMALARQATADAGEGTYGELRRFHSQQLIDEALRLCGTSPNGEVPSSCDASLDGAELPAAESVSALVDSTVAAANRVPDESVDVVVAQAIDAVALDEVDMQAVGLSGIEAEADVAAAQQLLFAEDQLRYGLTFALAYADEGLRERIRALLDASRERVVALQEILPPAAEPLDVPAAYVFREPDVEPENAEEATRLVDDLQRGLVDQWRLSAAQAESDVWRRDAIYFAAHAQRD